MRQSFLPSVLNVVFLCIIVFAVSVSFIESVQWIGLALILLSVLCLVSLIPFKVDIRSVLPDVLFGIIDNGILAIMAIFGGHFAGVAGAIIGGVAGNAMTDGIAGIIEGRMAENLRKKSVSEERTMLRSAVGKMAGCLLGAGVVLSINSVIKL